MSTDADKFLADLVMEPVLLSTSESLAMSNGEFSADLVMVVLSIEISCLANLVKPWIKTLIEVDRNLLVVG